MRDEGEYFLSASLKLSLSPLLLILFSSIFSHQAKSSISADCLPLDELSKESTSDESAEAPKFVEFDSGTVAEDPIPSRSLTPHEKERLKTYQTIIRRFKKGTPLKTLLGKAPEIEDVKALARVLHQEISQFSRLDQLSLDDSRVAVINPHFFKIMGNEIGPRATDTASRIYYEALTETLAQYAITPRRPNFRTFIFDAHPSLLTKSKSNFQREILKLFKKKFEEARESRDLTISDKEAAFILKTMKDPKMITYATGPGPVVTTTLTRMLKIDPDLKAETEDHILSAYKKFASEARRRYEKLLKVKSPFVEGKTGVSEEAIGIIRKITAGPERLDAYRNYFKKSGIEVADSKMFKQIEDFEKMVEYGNVFEPPLSLKTRLHPATAAKLGRTADALLDQFETSIFPELERLSQEPDSLFHTQEIQALIDRMSSKDMNREIKEIFNGLDQSSYPWYIGKILENTDAEYHAMTYVDLKDIGNRTTKNLLDWVVTRKGTGSTLTTALDKAERKGDLSPIIQSQGTAIRQWEQTVYKKIDHTINVISRKIQRELNAVIKDCCEVSTYFTGDDIRIGIQIRKVLTKDQVDLVKKALIDSHDQLSIEGTKVRISSALFKSPPHQNEAEARERLYRGLQTARLFGDRGLTEIVKPQEERAKEDPTQSEVIMMYEGFFDTDNGSWNFQPLNQNGFRVD